jgi:putative acetyltransferase
MKMTTTMQSSFDIREGVLSDFAKIEWLYTDAFPNEELRPLIRALLQDTPNVLSLVAIAESALIGHVVFTPCSVTGGSDSVALMGPLAVATVWQKRGIGSALVRAGLDWLRSADFDQVFVLGDPAYYGRFGFEAERSVAPPFPLPEEWREAWQSSKLRSTAPRLRGTLRVPRAWNEPTLWAP